MRVISGKAGGLRLKSLEGLNTRPTADRIKESLFNIIHPLLENAVVLDLFAGTGALGIEALSRGAKHTTFVDSNKDAVNIIKSNISHAKFESCSQVILSEFDRALKSICQSGIKYDIVFLDPPYGKGLEIKACEKLVELQLLNDQCIVIIEYEQKEEMPKELFGLKKSDERSYGRTSISFYKR